LRSERVPSAPVLDIDEVIAHPHLRERGTIRTIDDPHLGQFPVPGRPPVFSEWDYSDDLKAPLLGEHNHPVLHDLLGMQTDEIAALYDSFEQYAKQITADLKVMLVSDLEAEHLQAADQIRKLKFMAKLQDELTRIEDAFLD